MRQRLFCYAACLKGMEDRNGIYPPGQGRGEGESIGFRVPDAWQGGLWFAVVIAIYLIVFMPDIALFITRLFLWG
jgi:hypothetical protein